jgi:hypothetical protein
MGGKRATTTWSSAECMLKVFPCKRPNLGIKMGRCDARTRQVERIEEYLHSKSFTKKSPLCQKKERMKNIGLYREKISNDVGGKFCNIALQSSQSK